MMNKVQKKALVILSGLIFAQACFASPLNLIAPADGETNTPVDSYFQWDHASGTTKYVLDIDQFTQSEDNILASNACPNETQCFFYFLDLTAGNIEYLSSYQWKVTAYDAVGNVIDSSTYYSFSSEMPPPPPEGEGNGGNGGPIDLINPLEAESLEEAIEAVINFLFFLGFAIAPILIIYAAFLLVFNRGDPASINRARAIILWTLVAVAIILFSKGIPAIVRGILGS